MNPTKPRYRLAVDAALETGATVTLTGNAAHYLGTVLRLAVGDTIALFNRTQGEWCARITESAKRTITVQCEACLRPPVPHPFQLTVCFAPIKGGRMDTIIEKATELGASVLQPVLTSRSVVDKVNLERAEAIAREAAEQCERIDWPVIHPPVKLLSLLGEWPTDLPLIYGDERGEGESITNIATHHSPFTIHGSWAILTGPEGGFTAEEFTALTRVKPALGVGLGPRILRADTAVITLCVATMMAWGDWQNAPRFGS